MDREILLRQLVQAEQDAAAKAKKTAAGVTGSVGQQKKDKSIKGSVSDAVKMARPAPIKARQPGSILKLSPKASFYVSRMTAAARYSRRSWDPRPTKSIGLTCIWTSRTERRRSANRPCTTSRP